MHSQHTHSLAVLPHNKSAIEIMAQAHGSMVTMAQGFQPQIANVICLAPLGWRWLPTYLDYLTWPFLWRILLLSVDNIYKQMTTMRLWYHLYCPNDTQHLGSLNEIADVSIKCMTWKKIIDSVLRQYIPVSTSRFKHIVLQAIMRNSLICLELLACCIKVYLFSSGWWIAYKCGYGGSICITSVVYGTLQTELRQM